MNWRKTARRSAAIVAILVLSILCALIYQIVWDKIDRQTQEQSCDPHSNNLCKAGAEL